MKNIEYALRFTTADGNTLTIPQKDYDSAKSEYLNHRKYYDNCQLVTRNVSEWTSISGAITED